MAYSNFLEYTDERAGIAPLATIDFARLEQRNPAEIANLLNACTTHGFFYLDFSGSARAHGIVENKEKVLDFMKEYFSQPFDVKMKDNRNVRTRGSVNLLSISRCSNDTTDFSLDLYLSVPSQASTRARKSALSISRCVILMTC